MATYRINVPTTGGTITAATFNTSCVDNVNIDFTSDPDQMIRSTGVTSDGKVTIDCYADNTPTSRDWEFPLTYKSGSNYCRHTLHLYQEGSGGGEESHKIYVDVSTLVSRSRERNYELYFCKYAVGTSEAAREIQQHCEAFGTQQGVVDGKIYLGDLIVNRNGDSCTYVSDNVSSGEFWVWEKTSGGWNGDNLEHDISVYVLLVPSETSTPNYACGTMHTLVENDVTCGDYTMTAQ